MSYRTLLMASQVMLPASKKVLVLLEDLQCHHSLESSKEETEAKMGWYKTMYNDATVKEMWSPQEKEEITNSKNHP